jgi:hypothetical protein
VHPTWNKIGFGPIHETLEWESSSYFLILTGTKEKSGAGTGWCDTVQQETVILFLGLNSHTIY